MRYTLRDQAILRHVMRHPSRGESYSVRTLAAAVGLSHHSTIGHLASGKRNACDEDLARHIAECLGVGVLVLFAPSTSLAGDELSPAEDPPT